MRQGLALALVHVHATVHELGQSLDGVADGLDLVVDQFLFCFLLHKSLYIPMWLRTILAMVIPKPTINTRVMKDRMMIQLKRLIDACHPPWA